jgi:hypothetical protein
VGTAAGDHRGADAHRQRGAQQRRDQEGLAAQAHVHAEHAAHLGALRGDLLRWPREGLDLLAAQWLPEQRQLSFGGVGLGLATLTLQNAVAQLAGIHDTAGVDGQRGLLASSASGG